MVAYNFKRRFVAPILAGTKAQTIRAERAGRSRHARPGEPVQLYHGLRTRQVCKLGEPVCRSVERVTILLPAGRLTAAIVYLPYETPITPIDDRGDRDGFRDLEDLAASFNAIADRGGLDAFAVSDGFRDFDDMAAFWREAHPGQDIFEGVLIRWHPLVSADALDIAARAA